MTGTFSKADVTHSPVPLVSPGPSPSSTAYNLMGLRMKSSESGISLYSPGDSCPRELRGLSTPPPGLQITLSRPPCSFSGFYRAPRPREAPGLGPAAGESSNNCACGAGASAGSGRAASAGQSVLAPPEGSSGRVGAEGGRRNVPAVARRPSQRPAPARPRPSTSPRPSAEPTLGLLTRFAGNCRSPSFSLPLLSLLSLSFHPGSLGRDFPPPPPSFPV